MSEHSAEKDAGPMRCTVDDLDASGVGRCACSLVTATGGACPYAPALPTFAEAFPHLTASTDRPR